MGGFLSPQGTSEHTFGGSPDSSLVVSRPQAPVLTCLSMSMYVCLRVGLGHDAHQFARGDERRNDRHVGRQAELALDGLHGVAERHRLCLGCDVLPPLERGLSKYGKSSPGTHKGI